MADSFGLVSITRAFTSTSVLTVTPRIVPLARPPLGGYWLGDSEHGRRSIAASGEDDVAPRAYRTGDSLHRVHWRSTARYGELMVRREEQYWRNTASLFLDTRRSSYSSSMFELAVTAAASIGVHLAGEGFEARFVTSEGEVPRQGSFRDTLLDTLAVLRPSRAASLEVGLQALGTGGGQLIAVLGDIAAGAGAGSWRRPGAAPPRGWRCSSRRPGAAHVTASAQILAGAGWRVAVVPDAGAADGGVAGALPGRGARLRFRWRFRPGHRPGRLRMASHRRTAAAAFAVILASVSLYPIFTGALWFWAGCGAVIVVALAGTATRLRRLPVAVVLVLGVVRRCCST